MVLRDHLVINMVKAFYSATFSGAMAFLILQIVDVSMRVSIGVAIMFAALVGRGLSEDKEQESK